MSGMVDSLEKQLFVCVFSETKSEINHKKKSNAFFKVHQFRIHRPF